MPGPSQGYVSKKDPRRSEWESLQTPATAAGTSTSTSYDLPSYSEVPATAPSGGTSSGPTRATQEANSYEKLMGSRGDPALQPNAATGLILSDAEQARHNIAFTGKPEGLSLPEMMMKSAEAASMFVGPPVIGAPVKMGARAGLKRLASALLRRGGNHAANQGLDNVLRPKPQNPPRGRGLPPEGYKPGGVARGTTDDSVDWQMRNARNDAQDEYQRMADDIELTDEWESRYPDGPGEPPPFDYPLGFPNALQEPWASRVGGVTKGRAKGRDAIRTRNTMPNPDKDKAEQVFDMLPHLFGKDHDFINPNFTGKKGPKRSGKDALAWRLANTNEDEYMAPPITEDEARQLMDPEFLLSQRNRTTGDVVEESARREAESAAMNRAAMERNRIGGELGFQINMGDELADEAADVLQFSPGPGWGNTALLGSPAAFQFPVVPSGGFDLYGESELGYHHSRNRRRRSR